MCDSFHQRTADSSYRCWLRRGRGGITPLPLYAITLGAGPFLVELDSILTTGRYGLLLVCLAAIGITWAIIAVTAASIVTRLSPTNLCGDALGAYTALSGLATAIGSLLGGGIATRFGYLVTFLVAGGLVVIGPFLGYSLYRQPAQTALGVTNEPV